MAGGGGAQQSGQPDNSMGMIWTIAALFVFGAIIWFAFKKQLIGFYFAIKLWEINIISLFTNSLTDVQYVILQTQTRTS